TRIATACAGTSAAIGIAVGAELAPELGSQRRTPKTPYDRGHHEQHRDDERDAAGPSRAIPDQAGERTADAAADIKTGDIEADRRGMAVLGPERDEARRYALTEETAGRADRETDHHCRQPRDEREQQAGDPQTDRAEDQSPATEACDRPAGQRQDRRAAEIHHEYQAERCRGQTKGRRR